jgi:hypothetical protein
MWEWALHQRPGLDRAAVRANTSADVRAHLDHASLPQSLLDHCDPDICGVTGQLFYVFFVYRRYNCPAPNIGCSHHERVDRLLRPKSSADQQLAGPYADSHVDRATRPTCPHERATRLKQSDFLPGGWLA